MGLLFRKQVHNSLFAQFCPNFLMLRNCYKSASQSFYGYFPNTRTVFLWKRSYGYRPKMVFSPTNEKDAMILFFSPTNEKKAMIFFFSPTNEKEASLLFFYQPMRKKTHIAPCRANRDHGELFKTICSTRTLCLWWQ